MTPDPDLMRRAAAILAGARRAAVCTHVDPDGDAIGSVLALVHALEAVGVPCDAVLASGDRPPATYSFLPGAERFVRADALPARPEVVVALDTPNEARLGDAALLVKGVVTVALDHHPDHCAFATISIVDPEAPSTSALVWELVRALGAPPSQAIVDCVYCGLMTDTGRFSYANATSEAFRLAAELAEAGAQTERLYRSVYEQRSRAALDLIARALSRVTFVARGRVACSWITDDDLRETGALPEETEDLIDFVRAVRGPRAVALFKCSANGVKVSLRAKDEIDVGAIARALGGGGHDAAAGFTVSGTLDDALRLLLDSLPGGR